LLIAPSLAPVRLAPRRSPLWTRGFSIQSSKLFYSVFEKTLKVRATLDYGSRSLLQVGVHAIEERSSDLNVHTLFERNAVSNVS
jgi:hypothetical protein